MEFGGKIRMKPGLKKYACKLSLDPNTANTFLSLSEGNRKVKHVGEDQLYPYHPDRFEKYLQVLSVESMSGRRYWEVEWSGWETGVCCVSVSYRGIRRKGLGDGSGFGENDQSWSLEITGDTFAGYRFSLRHNNKETLIPVSSTTSYTRRVGVYLDWSAGTLSFYRICSHTHTRTLIHTVHTTFTEPLYAGLAVAHVSSIKLCVLE